MREHPKTTVIKSLELILDFLLLVLFLVQALVAGCLLTYGYIPIPEKLANQQLLKNSYNGFHIQADSFRLKLWQKIELVGLKIYHEETKGSVLDAASTEINFSFGTGGIFKPHLSKLIVTDGTLMIPAVYSPDGKRSAILENVTFHLSPTDRCIRISSFIAKHKDVYLRGSLEWPIQSGQKKEQASIHQIYRLATLAIKEKERFSPFIEPTLDFKLSTRLDNALDVSLILSSKYLKHSQATGTYFRAQTNYIVGTGMFVTQSPLLLQAETVNVPGLQLYAEDITAHVATEKWPQLLDGTFPEFTISANRLTIQQFELDAPEIRMDPGALPELKFSGSTSDLDGSVAFSGQLDSSAQSGCIKASGSIDLFKLLPKTVIQKLPKLEFDSAPFYNCSLTFDKGFKPQTIEFYVNTGNLTADELNFDYIIARGNYQDDFLEFEEIHIYRDRQWMDGALHLNTQNYDFDLSVKASVLPKQYNSLMPGWWTSVFEDLDFDGETPAYGDFFVHGNGKNSTFFGHVNTRNFIYKEADIDVCDLIVRNHKNMIELHNILAKRGDGKLNGSIGLILAKTGLTSVRYDLDAALPLSVISKIIGGDLVEILEEFELSSLPNIQANGVTFSEEAKAYTDQDAVELQASVDAPLKFKGAKLDYLNFDLFGQADDLYFRDIHVGYADGDAIAIIDILETDSDEPEMSLKFHLKDANQSKAIEYFPSLEDDEEPQEISEKDKIDLARCTGLVDMNLHARGPLGDIYGFDGYGNIMIRNENLGAIKLLGPLSQILKDTPLINFSFFNLNRMDVIFEVDREQLIVTTLEINGPRTKIWANGTMQLSSQALDMDVKASLFANAGRPKSAINRVGRALASPFPNLLSFKLGGTLENQKVRSQFDPRNLF